MKKCIKCLNELTDNANFCGKCGSPSGAEETSNQVIIKCGNCGYIGEGKPARRLISKILAWLCVVFAPLITILYFVATPRYRCPKCNSTFLGIKNKSGEFGGQRTGSKAVKVILGILVGVALTGIVASVILASLNSAREKAVQHDQSGWTTYHSVADNFSVLVPTSPSYSSESDVTDDGIDYEYHSYTSEKGETVFFVAKYIYAEPIDVTNPDNLLEKLMNGFVSGSEGKLISSNYTPYKSYKALDFVSKTLYGSYKGRVILVGETPYLLVAGYPTLSDIDTSYDTFVNSLEIK